MRTDSLFTGGERSDGASRLRRTSVAACMLGHAWLQLWRAITHVYPTGSAAACPKEQNGQL